MRYGYFDNDRREYVIDRVDVPVSWTNYLGTENLVTVLSHNAGGYSFYKSSEFHRMTRFRPNGVPLDRPGHYVYIRDDDTGEYWTVSWQPVGKDLSKAKYECRHGLSYSTFSCDYNDIRASQTLFIPIGDDAELWDVRIKNNGGKPRRLSVYSYVEFSWHHILIDNQNFQMSLYCAGSNYGEGVIENNLFYENNSYQYMTASFEPDGYDCTRDEFLGSYRTETNPIAVEKGECSGSAQLTGNHCGALMKRITLDAGGETRLVFMMGEGNRAEALRVKEKYGDFANVDKAFDALKKIWAGKLEKLQVKTPHEGMNTSLNTWNLYQAEVNVMFSRFSSFIEVGGRVGLGYRDTAQDSMCIPHSNPSKCKERILQLLRGLTAEGYGIHLFEPRWFDPASQEKRMVSPTIVHTPDTNAVLHDAANACSDDALWLVSSIVEYIKETGEQDFLDEVLTYAGGGSGSVYEHMTRILDFSAEQVGATGICKGLRADWNDCLNLGGGESAMVSFLHYWAINNFLDLLRYLGRKDDIAKYEAMAEKVRTACETELWDGKWYIRGITSKGRKIGTDKEEFGKVHMECNTWAVCSQAAGRERGIMAMDAVDEYLYSPYGLHLNLPAFETPDDTIGYVTKVYKGVKENGAIFSHPNPWAWIAECILGRGSRAMKYYDALLPYNQNDNIEVRQSEPYSYCQFVYGRDHSLFGKANHPWMTGTAGWAYFAATRYMLGVRPGFDGIDIDPCIPADWDGFEVTRVYRGAEYSIKVENPNGVEKGVVSVSLNGEAVDGTVPAQPAGSVNTVKVVMG
ncbi:MAG: N,N'-diacetylchitobiose phosphorylase [Clostridiales bacterium]|jgi:N,N'-diacetylchitobiose phosphorylase|nr:N,N'-diacetylchitobiose phosphorylase [Clostridiales bacterium]